MKKLVLSMLILLSSSLIFSCKKEKEIDPNPQQDGLQLSDEEKVVETFNRFVESLNRESETRATAVSKATVSSVRKISAGAYGGASQTRSSSDAPGLSTYELTLENPDNTRGFAVVADPAVFDQVIAYAPVGSIADTVYNKGLALYFRELAMLSDIVSKQSKQEEATRSGNNDPRQSGWGDMAVFIDWGSEEFVRWLAPEECGQGGNRSWVFYGPIDHEEIASAYVPTKWNQDNPYNSAVPYPHCIYDPVYKLNIPVLVGCYAVAVGQIMAYHRYPPTYNWDLLTASQTIPVVPLIHFSHGEYQYDQYVYANPTPTQYEVARLLYDIALAGKTTYKTTPAPGEGGTSPENQKQGLINMGYAVTGDIYDYMENEPSGTSSSVIRDEIQTYHRPVLYSAVGKYTSDGKPAGGHVWVVDAVLTFEQWEYISFWGYGPDGYTGEGLNRYRTQGRLLHCNWGWGGNSDGWYYSFIPSHGGKPIEFYTQKILFTGIHPK